MIDFLGQKLNISFLFQFQDVDLFSWTDHQGRDHPLVPTNGNSSCNLKYPAWMSNKGEITNISQLPIKTIKYGPIRFELEKVKVIVGPVVCQPSENGFTIREQMVANQIEDLGNELKNENENLKTKMTQNSEIIEKIEKIIIVCPIEKSGYFEVHGKCYFTDSTLRNFDDSQAHCKEIFPLGGRLYEPREQTAYEEVRKFKKRYHGHTSIAWIGITDRISHGEYRYASDNGHLTISQWCSGEPNGSNEHCVIMYKSTDDWHDFSCSGQLYHFCERTY